MRKDIADDPLPTLDPRLESRVMKLTKTAKHGQFPELS